MPLSTQELYKAHVQNRRAVESACTQIYRECKRCLATRQDTAARSLLKTFTLLIGAWSEVRLLKLLHEDNGFSGHERTRILAANTKVAQWQSALEIGFRRRYNVPAAAISRQSLPATAYLRYHEMVSLIENDLRPIVEIRNKLAHGQWARTLNAELTGISSEMMALLNTENALSANYKMKILEVVSRLVNDLMIGGAAFDRDFDSHYRQLEQTKTNLRSRSFDEWEGMLRSKFGRGRVSNQSRASWA